ncbi:hypothetical protein HO133_010633 [Letharia lupina]|uniref:Uncharacterized protein n=1 Tax=Letharia lupina TaxID=560253 RepID=A0A8H6FDP3_9LECA|nr:uncharacterized protein HO133_010633 [Letharia lupina]KAF6224059.1 hypothetical protein HO133_010633 [Letharia lupina]
MSRITAIHKVGAFRRLVTLNTPRAYDSYYPGKHSIDFAYFPQYELREPAKNEIMRIPILPFNSSPPARSNEALESVIRPEITTASANGTHIESPSAMSDVTDNPGHTDLDPFDLTNTVTTAASEVTGLPIERLQEPGVVKELWNGLLDDILGARKTAKA